MKPHGVLQVRLFVLKLNIFQSLQWWGDGEHLWKTRKFF